MTGGGGQGVVQVGGLACSLSTIDDLLAQVRGALAASTAPEHPLSILCVNAHIFNLAWDDGSLRDRLNAAEVLALDGMAMVWAARRAGARTAERCNMTEAFRAFLAQPDLPGTSALVIGLDDASVARGAAAIDDLGTPVRVTRAVGGYESLETYRSIVASGDFDLVLVGCGTPRSEQVVDAVVSTGATRVVWHVGGGTLRFLAGDAREAPAWMRRSGTQWLHRLAAEPRAMWRRYVLGNPRFVWRVLRGGRGDAHR